MLSRLEAIKLLALSQATPAASQLSQEELSGLFGAQEWAEARNEYAQASDQSLSTIPDWPAGLFEAGRLRPGLAEEVDELIARASRRRRSDDRSMVGEAR